jgi:hypothetical protein
MALDSGFDEVLGHETETIDQAEEYAPGELAPSIVTPSKVWKPADLLKEGMAGVLTDLARTCSNTDEAARRFQVLQTWELRHVDRGYQYLEDDGRGGWKIAGVNNNSRQNFLSAGDDSGLYPTNILSAQGDIACGALNRGKIKVNFSPKRLKDPRSVRAAETANQYKHLWQKYNTNLQREIAELGWTDCRVVTWTRTVADKRFGVDEQGRPRQIELTTPHGVLESKLPMMVDSLGDMSYIQIFEEMDYAVARAAYPWMGDRIKPSWGTYGELEFERIARINTRIGIIGKYITGTSGIREATMGYMWFRPGMYFDDQISAPQREFLLKNFPSGLFLVMAGPEVCCAWDESMDDHVAVGIYMRGFGQNRRSLGSSDLPIQKRINIWADLWDKFVRSAIPITLLEDKAFNAEAVSQLEASPSRFLPVALDEGQTMEDVVGQTPAPQPVPGMSEMFQWYVGPLIQMIDGATPALFGGAEGADNTVGATQIRLNQSLERFGPTWIMMNHIYARCAWQAAKSCSLNGSGDTTDTVEGIGEITVNPQDMQGDIECSPETLGSIPESGAQREAKVLQVLEMANGNPEVAQLIATASNTREIVNALGLQEVITVDEADSEDLALENVDALLESEPLLNPAWMELSQQLEQANALHENAKQMAASSVAAGSVPDTDEIQMGAQLEQEIGKMQQQLQQTPKYQPSVPVADDGSQDNATIAATVFSWMQSTKGRGLRLAASREAEGGEAWKKWTNVFLYWKGNRDAAQQQAANNQQPVPPKITISIPADKMEGQTQAKLLQKAGIQVSPPSGQPHEVEQESRFYGPQAEIVTKTRRRL